MSNLIFNSPDKLWGGVGADQFTRHKSVLGSDDTDVFNDYNSAEGDTTNNVWYAY